MPDTEIIIDNSMVILEGPEYHTTIGGINVWYREGTWCEPDNDGEMMPDWSLTWFYTDKTHPENYLYFEQDPPETALYNLYHMLESKPETETVFDAA